MSIPIDARAGHEVFALPPRATTLSNPDLRQKLGYEGDFISIPDIVERLGLEFAATLPTKKAHWTIHEKRGFKVTRFPGEDIEKDLAVALYEKNNQPEVEHVIARISAKPLDRQELTWDLATFTRAYIERPLVLGLPSTLTRTDTATNIGGLLGVALASANHYLAPESLALKPSDFGLILGITAAGAITGGGLSYLMWRRIDKKVADPGQYVADANAQELLTKLVDHGYAVTLKRELFAMFRGDGEEDLSPDDFLTRIYKRLPQDVIDDRKLELKIGIPSDQSLALKALVAHGRVNLSYQSGALV